MSHTIIGDRDDHARFHDGGLYELLVLMRDAGSLPRAAHPLVLRWIEDLEAREREGYVELDEEALRADEAREGLREAAHAAARQLAEPGTEAPPALAKAVSDREAQRLRMLAQARELAGYLDRWHARAEGRAPAA